VAGHVDLDFVDVVAVRRVVVGSLPGAVGECGVVHLVDEQRPPLLSGIGDCRALGGCGCGLRGEECGQPAFQPRTWGQKRRCWLSWSHAETLRRPTMTCARTAQAPGRETGGASVLPAGRAVIVVFARASSQAEEAEREGGPP